MNFQVSNAKQFKSIESQALQKISSFVTRFHAMLLPKANDSGVFRDLSQQQQYLLTTLDSQNPLHSILAGCLAIDSCLSNISQQQQNLTNNILRALTTLCSTWHRIQNELVDSIETKSLTVQKIEQMCRQAQQNTKKLLNYCYDLPYGEQNEEIKKQEKIMSQQDITFKLGSMKLFEDNDEQNYDKKSNQSAKKIKSSQTIKCLKKQKLKLQEQLSYAEKKIVQLQLKISKLSDSNIPFIKQTQQQTKQKYHQRKYSQTGKGERFNSQLPTSFSKFATPSSSNTIQQRETQMMRDQIIFLEEQIKKIKDEFAKQRRQLINQIKFLEEELKIADANQDKELVELLEELQDQIQSLREERRHDERIIQQIQSKLSGMSVSRIGRIKKSSRVRESRAAHSHLYHQRQIFDDVNLGRGHQFKKQRNKRRMFTNEEVSRSSTSMPRTNSYKYSSRQGQKLKFNWKERIKPVRESYEKPIEHQQRYEQKMSKHSQNYWSPQIRLQRQQRHESKFESKHEQNKKMLKRNLYDLPLVESKHGLQSFAKGSDNQLKNRRKDQDYKKGRAQQLQMNRIDSVNEKHYQLASNKAIRWQQITNNGGSREQEPRLKTSRI